MSNIKLLKYNFKPEGKQQWLTWVEELEKRADEVYVTLRGEGVRVEACFISEKDNACFYLIEAVNVENAFKISKMSEYSIDKEHVKLMQSTMDLAEDCDLLFYFPNHS